jgi:hypothetical protein
MEGSARRSEEPKQVVSFDRFLTAKRLGSSRVSAGDADLLVRIIRDQAVSSAVTAVLERIGKADPDLLESIESIAALVSVIADDVDPELVERATILAYLHEAGVAVLRRPEDVLRPLQLADANTKPLSYEMWYRVNYRLACVDVVRSYDVLSEYADDVSDCHVGSPQRPHSSLVAMVKFFLGYVEARGLNLESASEALYHLQRQEFPLELVRGLEAVICRQGRAQQRRIG